MSNFVATDVYALFNIHVKNPQHSCVKIRGGGSWAVYTMYTKTSDLVPGGFPKIHTPINFDMLHITMWVKRY